MIWGMTMDWFKLFGAIIFFDILALFIFFSWIMVCVVLGVAIISLVVIRTFSESDIFKTLSDETLPDQIENKIE
jgi:hypothetical protein